MRKLLSMFLRFLIKLYSEHEKSITNRIYKMVCWTLLPLIAAFVLFCLASGNVPSGQDLRMFIYIWGFMMILALYIGVANRRSNRNLPCLVREGAAYMLAYINSGDRKHILRRSLLWLAELACIVGALLGAIYYIFPWVYKYTCGKKILIVVLALAFASLIFIYSRFDRETVQMRKVFLGSFLSVLWLIFVSVQIVLCWESITIVTLMDLVVFFFSVVFTIPTMASWAKFWFDEFRKCYSEQAERNMMGK